MEFDAARRLVLRHVRDAFPGFRAAMVSGSVVRNTTTPTSDIDVIVLVEDGVGSRREVVEWDGHTVDLFAYDDDGLHRWLAQDIEQRRPVLSTLLLDGVPVTGSAAATDAAKAAAQSIFDEGPRLVKGPELTRMRYVVTDLLLDVEWSMERAETLMIAAELFSRAGDLVLAAARVWSGKGKWLLQELRDYDAVLTADLVAGLDEVAHSDARRLLIESVETALDHVGGRYLVGRSDEG